MSIKPHIFRDVHANDVAPRLPLGFRQNTNHPLREDTLHTLITFPGEHTIVESKAARKALLKASGDENQLVLVAHNFTSEARELIEQQGAILFVDSDFFWTDASWKNIRDKQ